MIFLAGLLLPILSTPGILTQPRGTASSRKAFLLRGVFSSLWTDVNGSLGCVAQWEKAGGLTPFPVC